MYVYVCTAALPLGSRLEHVRAGVQATTGMAYTNYKEQFSGQLDHLCDLMTEMGKSVGAEKSRMVANARNLKASNPHDVAKKKLEEKMKRDNLKLTVKNEKDEEKKKKKREKEEKKEEKKVEMENRKEERRQSKARKGTSNRVPVPAPTTRLRAPRAARNTAAAAKDADYDAASDDGDPNADDPSFAPSHSDSESFSSTASSVGAGERDSANIVTWPTLNQLSKGSTVGLGGFDPTEGKTSTWMLGVITHVTRQGGKKGQIIIQYLEPAVVSERVGEWVLSVYETSRKPFTHTLNLDHIFCRLDWTLTKTLDAVVKAELDEEYLDWSKDVDK